jgi:aminopeptidase N
MESPGCVTFRDPYVFQSRVLRTDHTVRASTIAHEMAHMWFGDIVTPVWWDDLWLNESFAEYMGARVTADATDFSEVWVTEAYNRKSWGLTADQRPSTHPVAGNGAEDAATALQNFDGISYAKGASVLKQLNSRLGDEVFLGGVRDHFEKHRYGNATMADLLEAWEGAGAGDLSGFRDNWLLTAGPDRLSFDRAAGVVRRTAPAGHPADRHHSLGIAEAGAAGQGTWRVERLEIDADAVPTKVSAGPVVLDAGVDSWVVTLPDPETLTSLPDALPATRDPLLRASVWLSVRNAFQHALLAPDAALDLVEAAIPHEDTDDGVGQTLAWAVAEVVPVSTDPSAARARIHEVARRCVTSAGAGSSLQLSAFQVQAAASDDAAELLDWLAGGAPAGVVLDLDLRWRILRSLARLGGIDRDGLARALAEEVTAVSQVEHAGATASLPDAEAKAWAWDRFTGVVEVPNYELEAIGLGIWQLGQESLTDPYVDRYFDDVPQTAHFRSGWLLAQGTTDFYPRWSVSEQTLARARALLARDDLASEVRRGVVDQTWDLERRLAIRDAFPADRGGRQ